jgi:hypothetical protein
LAVGHRLQVAVDGESLEPEGIEEVAREQPEIGIGGVDQPRTSVMEEVALADRLDQQ